MRWAMEQRLPLVQKAVLLVLADHARGGHRCWPSVARIGEMAGCKDRAVQGAIVELQRAGLILRLPADGRSTTYVLSVTDVATPAEYAPQHDVQGSDPAPPQNMHPTPAEYAPPPPQNMHPNLLREPIKLKQEEDAPCVASPADAADHADMGVSATGDPRGKRLPPNWQPDSLDRAFAVGLGLDVDATAAEFRDFWHAVPGLRGRKADWSATWRNSCRRASERQATRSPARASSPGERRQASNGAVELLLRAKDRAGLADTHHPLLKLEGCAHVH